MTPQVQHLLEEALRLSNQERGELADKLIDSLDPIAEHEVEQAWNDELRSRLDQLDRGEVRPIPWPEARQMILEETDESAGV